MILKKSENTQAGQMRENNRVECACDNKWGRGGTRKERTPTSSLSVTASILIYL